MKSQQSVFASGFTSRAGLRGVVSHIKGRIRVLALVFTFGFIISYPITERMIVWASGNGDWRPDNVEIIIIQPLELIILKLKISVNMALGATLLAMIADLSLNGARIISHSTRTLHENQSPSRLILISLASVALGVMGICYANYVLIPFLMEYLVQDSTAAGLNATWQVGSWLGFILGLLTASAVGFQVPLAVFVLIRSGLISPETITGSRSILWFAALVAGAFLSPPDPLSMFLVGGPVVILMELAIQIERVSGSREVN